MKRPPILLSFLKKKRPIDFWSIPHFLFGAVTALFAATLSIPSGAAFFSTLVLAILWELFEKKEKIRENIRNRIADVLLPLVAFPATLLFTQKVAVEQERRVALLATVSVLFLYVNLAAWRARSERDRDFTG